MSNASRRKFILASAAAPFATALTARADSGAKPGVFQAAVSGREALRRRSFPNVALTTHEGKTVRFYDDLLKDKLVVLNLMYADCDGICPVITQHLVEAQKILNDRGHRVGRDLFFYSITVKPEKDTPQALRDYAEMHHVGPGWTFLTGKPADIELLRQKLGYVDPDPKIDKDKSQHSGIIRYGNEARSLWGACQGNAKPEWIAEEISFVIRRQEASPKVP